MKRAELLPISGSGLCDLSRARLVDYLTAIVGDREVPETDEAWNERLCALGFMVEREGSPPACTIADEIDRDELAASDRLLARRLDTQMWTRQVGFRYARRLPRRFNRQCLRNSRLLLPFEGR